MFTKRNNFTGAAFDYQNEGCRASGEYRYVDTVLAAVSINGTYKKDGASYNFWANRGADGNLNINGVPKEVIEDVAGEVRSIIDEIENLNTSEE